METTPTPVFRSLHQIGSQSIAFDVPAQGEKMIIILHRKRLESPLIKVPGTRRFTMSVPSLRVSQRQPADKPRQLIIFLRPHDQMPVISHQAIGQQPCSRPSHRFLKHGFECDEIFILRKDRAPRVRTVQNMINPTTWSCSFWSSHHTTIPDSIQTVNKRFLTPFCAPFCAGLR